MRFSVVIPARYSSQRLPGKPLADLGGKPLILHACASAQASGADQVIVATDDERIREVCAKAGVQTVMTAAHHASGTDRIAEVAQVQGWDDDERVVNLQGDEPMMPPINIRQTAQLLESGADMS